MRPHIFIPPRVRHAYREPDFARHFERWMGHPLPPAHRALINELERRRARRCRGLYLIDDHDALTSDALNDLLLHYFRWLSFRRPQMRQLLMTYLSRPKVCGRVNRTFNPGCEEIFVATGHNPDNVRGQEFEYALLLDADCYGLRGLGYTDACRAILPMLARRDALFIAHGRVRRKVNAFSCAWREPLPNYTRIEIRGLDEISITAPGSRHIPLPRRYHQYNFIRPSISKRPEGASLCDNPRCSIGDASLGPRSQTHHHPPVLHQELSARRVRRREITPGVASEMQAWGLWSQRDNGASSGGDAVITANATHRHPVSKSGHSSLSSNPVGLLKRPPWMVLSGILAEMPDTATMAKRLEYEMSSCSPEQFSSPHDRRSVSRAGHLSSAGSVSRAKRPEGASPCGNPGRSIGDASLGTPAQTNQGASSGGDAVITANAPHIHPVSKAGHSPSAGSVSRAKRPEGASLCDNPRCSIGDASLGPPTQTSTGASSGGDAVITANAPPAILRPPLRRHIHPRPRSPLIFYTDAAAVPAA